ncbi:hypothetical protein [Flavobacterium sp. WG21]|uniref:hypothetical protein n=1 Tax=Flavobacterium sp. WG21 TaxID=1229487 RepID=UPI000381E2D3|nr:hypothetical protein [Flavobacterium sp. WG21]
MKKILIVILLISIGCTNKQKELEYLICKDSTQYWNYEWPRDRAQYYGFTFSLSKDGKLKKYSYDKIKNRRSFFWDIPDPDISKWSVSKDSVLTVMGDKDKIIKYTDDTIYVISLQNKTKSYYVRVKGDLNISKDDNIPNL